MTDVFQTLEATEDHLVLMGLPSDINSTNKNDASYKRKVAMALRMRKLIMILANDRPPGMTIDVSKLPYTINTIYNYVCNSLTVLEMHSSKENFSNLNNSYRTKMQGESVLILSKAEYAKRKMAVTSNSIDAIDLATKVVAGNFSLKDEISEWLEDVGGEDRKIIENIVPTVDEKGFLDRIKLDGMIYEWFYVAQHKILTVLRVRGMDMEVEEETV